ncbi:hypothetical protein [Streptomyces sp. Da 82-17]|uniref:hypothetical protein n=1 Tax=Streptomyces sp. Da 82-17 TaxID=3377116 RepID=UPI0038D4CCE8
MNSTTKQTAALTAALATAAALALAASAPSASAALVPDAALGPGDAAERSAAAKPYVLNHHGEANAEAGSAQRRPERLVLSEFTTAHGLRWERWGAEQAVGVGRVTGSWCAETCLDRPLKATLRLLDPRTVDGRRVYSAFTLTVTDKAGGTYQAEDLRGKRALATR